MWGILLNLIRYIGWFGDQGVQLFIIISGFGLTWGLLNHTGLQPFPLGHFYTRRSERVFPLWWGAHLLFIAFWLLTGWGLSAFNINTYLSTLGIRFTPELFYYFSPAWWYIGLLIQLYLVFPLLWMGLRRIGPIWLLVIACLIAFPARAFGLLNFTTYMDPWQRGAIFITRLPEFVFGISLAYWFYQSKEKADQSLRSFSVILLGILTYALGMVLSLFLLGMTFAPFLLGVGVFILFYNILKRWKIGGKIGEWIGQHSYSLYLIHHPIIILVVPLGITGLVKMGMNALLAAGLTLVVAVSLEWGVNRIKGWLVRPRRWSDRIKVLLGIFSIGVVIIVGLVAGELLVRAYAPQEVLGWGERPSLEPDVAFGWKLTPSQKTRLRWEGYDYVVTANDLGFPGPEYPVEKDPDTFRIMVVGDAFSSAEGVDTENAWPRLLEKELRKRLDQEVEVLDFAITGYGPNQYASVIETFAPQYKPDLIMVESFVNDFQDVLWSDTDFQLSIGFNQPNPQSITQILRLVHLRRLIRLQLIEPLNELLRDRPREHGYFLGNYQFLERDHPELEGEGKDKVRERMKQIDGMANQIGAKIAVILVPAPIQVCEKNQLAYAPKNIDLEDTTRFDQDLPQRMMAEITADLEIPLLDLRPVLSSAQPECLYRSDNMHWTLEGHQVVADSITKWLERETLLSNGD